MIGLAGGLLGGGSIIPLGRAVRERRAGRRRPVRVRVPDDRARRRRRDRRRDAACGCSAACRASAVFTAAVVATGVAIIAVACGVDADARDRARRGGRRGAGCAYVTGFTVLQERSPTRCAAARSRRSTRSCALCLLLSLTIGPFVAQRSARSPIDGRPTASSRSASVHVEPAGRAARAVARRRDHDAVRARGPAPDAQWRTSADASSMNGSYDVRRARGRRRASARARRSQRLARAVARDAGAKSCVTFEPGDTKARRGDARGVAARATRRSTRARSCC